MANGRTDTPGTAPSQAPGRGGSDPVSRREVEAAAVSGPAIFAEWLIAHELMPGNLDQQLLAIEAFAGLEPRLGWAGNLRRRRSDRVAIRRGRRVWTFRHIGDSEAEWRLAAGPCADGSYAILLRMVADHLLAADTRPDDTLTWRGDPADPWPFGALFIGATLVIRPPPPSLGEP